MSMRPHIPVRTVESEEALAFIRQRGVENVSLMLKPDEITREVIQQQKEKLARHHLTISDAACGELQKNRSIHLNLPDRDEQIEKFNQMLVVLGEEKIPFTSIAWQPHGILRTCWKVGEHTRGGSSMFCDESEIMARPNAEPRTYTEEEIWENFTYFMDKVIPVAEETGVRMALHPNDPPLACMAGIPSLIYNMECYRKAFRAAKGSKALGIKLCVGCWLESGSEFGDLMSDIKELCADDRILCVHFRNVSSQLPMFEEVLPEDGYADMYAIMKQLVACDCNAVISIDHGFKPMENFGGMPGSFCYPTGFMKGLMWAAEKELGKR